MLRKVGGKLGGLAIGVVGFLFVHGYRVLEFACCGSYLFCFGGVVQAFKAV